MLAQVPKLERRVLLAAIVVSVVHLLLIAYAALFLGISVPDCITDKAAFAEPAFITHGPKHYEVHLNARMWMYQPNYIKLPTGSRLDIFLSAKDVQHGLFIEKTNVNLMAVPGAIANATVTFRQPGRYQMICHEFCGIGHQDMQGTIEVVDGLAAAEVAGISKEAIRDANAGAKDELAAVVETAPSDPGKKLYETKGCAACHSLDGSKLVGPSFKGLYGSQVKLADGSTRQADDAYIKQKISDPMSMVVAGFSPGLMPKMQVSAEELNTLVDFIKAQK